MATSAYEELMRQYMNYYNEDNFDTFNLPNNLIDLDDIIQDFYVKSIEVLDNYLSNNILCILVNIKINYYQHNFILLDKINFEFVAVIKKAFLPTINLNEVSIEQLSFSDDKVKKKFY